VSQLSIFFLSYDAIAHVPELQAHVWHLHDAPKPVLAHSEKLHEAISPENHLENMHTNIGQGEIFLAVFLDFS
jgi:hypothetical protein